MSMMAARRAKRLALLEKGESVPIRFAVVGVQKAATSTLYAMLVQHPEVLDGPQKELRFFIENRDWDHPDYTTYRRPLRRGQGRLAGDATPAYLFWPHALERMHAYDARMPLVATFRDPVERAFSQWAMERTRDAGFPDLPEAIERYGADPLPERLSESDTATGLRRSLFTRGYYGAQVERALATFPRRQWLFLEFRDLLSDHRGALDRTTDHLGIARFESYPELVQRSATSTSNPGTAPTATAFASVVERYGDDLALFEKLTDIDTSAWPTRRVISGELPVEEFHAKLCGKLGLAP